MEVGGGGSGRRPVHDDGFGEVAVGHLLDADTESVQRRLWAQREQRFVKGSECKNRAGSWFK